MSKERIGLPNLPAEIQRSILASLPDPRSLALAALVCRALYSTFKADENSLIRDVLVNCVGFNTLPEALITHRCSPPYLSVRDDELYVHRRWEPKLHLYVSDFLQSLERPAITSIICTMRDAIKIGDFHSQVVSVLTQRFIQACARAAPSLPTLEESLRWNPASPSERTRIARTLYRFETFRKLFGCFWDSDRALLHYSSIFFSKFAPWENAQLGCIHDFLAREVMPGEYTLSFCKGGNDLLIYCFSL